MKIKLSQEARERFMRRFFSRSKKAKFRTPRERRLMSQKLQRMPDARVYASNHVMINRERVKNYISVLKRNSFLDEIARNHARYMSQQRKVFLELEETNNSSLRECFDPTSLLLINANRGANVRMIQKGFMKSDVSKNKILNARVDMMGVGSSIDSRGRAYVCQIFAGAIEK